jgi:arginase
MKIHLITVPYHMGQKAVAVGLGPVRYLEGGLEALIQSGGHQVTLVPIDVGESAKIERVNAAVTDAVAVAEASRAFPMVVAGNCNSCLGTLAGLRTSGLGIAWFDAHGDFHTPETSISGNPDGMALGIATERFVPEARTMLAGVRDLDPGERERVAGSRMRVIPWERPFAITNLPAAERVYVHVDIDVVDPAVNPGVNFRGAGGLSFEQLEDALRAVRARNPLAAAALTNYNPERDVDFRTRDLGLRIARVMGTLF